MTEPVLKLDRVSKSYPGFELQDVSFELPRGYIMGLIGPNGAGKTTTIRLIMNLARPDSGKIRLFGIDSSRSPQETKRRIGYVGENQNFYDEMRVSWTAGFVRQYYPQWDQGLFQTMLDRFGVDPKKKVGALSKGTRVKLACALAIAHHPELLILDEPTSGLDPVVRQELLAELLAFVRAGDRSVLFSSHITQDLERIADYITLIIGGRIVDSTDKEDLLDRHRRSNPTASLDDLLILLVKGGK